MEDIFLTATDAGHFDWQFKKGSIQGVTGVQAIISAARHKILLKRNELQQAIYQNKGNRLNEYIKQPYNEETIKLIKNEIKLICKEIDGVNAANVEIKENENGIIITRIILDTDAGAISVGI